MEARDEGTDYLEATKPDHVTIINDISEADLRKYKLLIIVSPYNRSAPYGMLELHFVPMIGTIGFGLAHHPDDYYAIYDQIDEAFAERGILPCAHRYCTIDVKEDEEFCAMLEDEYDEEVVFYTAEELAAEVIFTKAMDETGYGRKSHDRRTAAGSRKTVHIQMARERKIGRGCQVLLDRDPDQHPRV